MTKNKNATKIMEKYAKQTQKNITKQGHISKTTQKNRKIPKTSEKKKKK